MLSAVAADDEFLYGSSPGTDTDHGLAPALSTTLQQPAQGTAARVWASGYQEHDQVFLSLVRKTGIIFFNTLTLPGRFSIVRRKAGLERKGYPKSHKPSWTWIGKCSTRATPPPRGARSPTRFPERNSNCSNSSRSGCNNRQQQFCHHNNSTNHNRFTNNNNTTNVSKFLLTIMSRHRWTRTAAPPGRLLHHPGLAISRPILGSRCVTRITVMN